MKIFGVGIILGWSYPLWEFSGWELSWVAVFWVVNVRVGVILGGYFPRREFSGWELSGGNHPGGSFHVTTFLMLSALSFQEK